jgi:hypothetical protein
MRRIHQEHGTGAFKQIEDRFSILPRAFHGDMGNTRLRQPVGQSQQIAGHCPKRPESRTPLGLLTGRIRGHPAGDDTLLMDVQAFATWKHYIHLTPPCP